MDARESAHFRVHAPTTAAAARLGAEADAFAEAFVKRWSGMYGARLPETRWIVYAFPDADALRRYGQLMRADQLEGVGGYFSSEERLIALASHDPATLRHEVTHLLTVGAWKLTTPAPWLSEGLAQYHESGVEGSWSPEAAAFAAKLLSIGELPDFARLIEASRSSLSPALLYPASAALFAWLMKAHPDAVPRIIEDARAPAGTKARDVAGACGRSVEDADRAWKEFIQQGR
jgi:hypothetical protein